MRHGDHEDAMIPTRDERTMQELRHRVSTLTATISDAKRMLRMIDTDKLNDWERQTFKYAIDLFDRTLEDTQK